ncbi:MAG: hypothetical protein U0941_14530 [Planctomycetaceae bacterium]
MIDRESVVPLLAWGSLIGCAIGVELAFVARGIYSLHEPIVIGSAFGVPVKLAVGDRAMVDALESTFTDSSEASGDSE